MCASWRRRLSSAAAAIMIVGAPTSVIASGTIHSGGAVAGQICPAGTNWDGVNNSCH